MLPFVLAVGTKISIHAPREGGDAVDADESYLIRISIHAPREGGDACAANCSAVITISIHAPREGGDLAGTSTGTPHLIFQSTPPARGATTPYPADEQRN